MKFDNEKAVFKLHFFKIFLAILIGSVIIVFFTTSFDDRIEELTGITKRAIILVMIAGYLFFYLYHLIIKTSFLFFSDEGSKIIIRFYPLRPLNPAKSSIEIPKNQFYKYAINKTSLREEVILYMISGTKISKYPPFSLKGLSKQQREKLLHALNQYVQQPIDNDVIISQ
jgi:hypothetical protein